MENEELPTSVSWIYSVGSVVKFDTYPLWLIRVLSYKLDLTICQNSFVLVRRRIKRCKTIAYGNWFLVGVTRTFELHNVRHLVPVLVACLRHGSPAAKPEETSDEVRPNSELRNTRQSGTRENASVVQKYNKRGLNGFHNVIASQTPSGCETLNQHLGYAGYHRRAILSF